MKKRIFFVGWQIFGSSMVSFSLFGSMSTLEKGTPRKFKRFINVKDAIKMTNIYPSIHQQINQKGSLLHFEWKNVFIISYDETLPSIFPLLGKNQASLVLCNG
jgi:hypothetical protein